LNPAATLKPDLSSGVGSPMTRGMPGIRNPAMWTDDEPIRGRRLPKTLELPPSHTVAIVGYLLKAVREDALAEPHPHPLMALIERLDERERTSMPSSHRLSGIWATNRTVGQEADRTSAAGRGMTQVRTQSSDHSAPSGGSVKRRLCRAAEAPICSMSSGIRKPPCAISAKKLSNPPGVRTTR